MSEAKCSGCKKRSIVTCILNSKMSIAMERSSKKTKSKNMLQVKKVHSLPEPTKMHLQCSAKGYVQLKRRSHCQKKYATLSFTTLQFSVFIFHATCLLTVLFCLFLGTRCVSFYPFLFIFLSFLLGIFKTEQLLCIMVGWLVGWMVYLFVC